MKVTDLAIGDTAVFRNGGELVVTHLFIDSPSEALDPTRNVYVHFINMSECYTPSLNLRDGVEDPYDIVAIKKESSGLLNEIYNPDQAPTSYKDKPRLTLYELILKADLYNRKQLGNGCLAVLFQYEEFGYVVLFERDGEFDLDTVTLERYEFAPALCHFDDLC